MRALCLWTLLLVPVLLAAHTLPVGATLSGTVRDAQGDPLEGANVSIVGTALGAQTGADGRFEITGAQTGTAEVRITHVGFEAHVETVTLTEGETVRLDADLVEADVELVVGAREGRARRDAFLDARGASARPAAAAPMMAPSSSGRIATESAGMEIRGGRAESVEYYVDGVRVGEADDREAPATPPGRTRRSQSPQAGLLTAGDIDDGLNWDAFLGYSSRAMNRGSSLRDLRLDDRLTLRVLDRDGRPVAGARIRIDPTGGTERGLTTEAGTDGRLALFPRYDFGTGVRRLDVTIREPGRRGATERLMIDLTRLSGDTQRVVRLRTRSARPQALDLAVVLDVTGSMGDEHRYITDEFEAIVARAQRQYPDADLRFALVAYRDRGDDFVVRRWDFTRDASEMQQRLAQLSAGGGGDMPEAVDEALDAMLDLDWRTGTAARIAFLVGDAPPHATKLDETLAAVREARARGLRIYPLAASGVDATAEHIFRTAAVLTQGRYLWLTDDSGVGNAHGEPNVPCYQVSRVNDLMARVIESELAGRRIEADRQEIVRTVGNPVNGVCGGAAVSFQNREAQPRQSGGLGYD